IEQFARNEAEALRADELLRQVVSWPTVKNSAWFTDFNGDVRLAAAELSGRIDAELVPGTSLLQVAVTAPEPDEAGELLDALLTVYLQNEAFDVANQHSAISARIVRERERAHEALRRLQLERDRFIHENDLA
ncbi:unnamed protein product, partial [Ectocarpus fasciculatus]